MHSHERFLFFTEIRKQEAQLSPGKPTVLVVSDFQSHPRSMILHHLKGRMRLPISDQ